MILATNWLLYFKRNHLIQLCLPSAFLEKEKTFHYTSTMNSLHSSSISFLINASQLSLEEPIFIISLFLSFALSLSTIQFTHAVVHFSIQFSLNARSSITWNENKVKILKSFFFHFFFFCFCSSTLPSGWEAKQII